MNKSPVFILGSGLQTRLASDAAGHVAAMGDIDCRPEVLELQPGQQSYAVPYMQIKDPAIQLGEQRIYEIIDNVIEQALTEAGVDHKAQQSLGVFLGSTSFDIFNAELRIKHSQRSDRDIVEHTPPFTLLSEYIRERFEIQGPLYTFNTACTSSANALMYAAETIRAGHIEAALVVGLEFFNEMSALGFMGLQLFSQSAMRPFAVDRDGLFLGEACAAVVVSSQGDQSLFKYLGGANLTDDYSVTASNPDGSRVAQVIDLALSDADIGHEQIKLVKAHATASLSNDESEARGMQTIFGDIPPLVLLKPVLGHTLGACGLAELVLFCQCIQSKTLPRFSQPWEFDPAYALRLANTEDLNKHGCYLLNYFGFGGNNTSIVIADA